MKKYLSVLLFSFAFIVTSCISYATQNNDKININQATAERLMNKVKGIGIKRAQSIVKYRSAHGLFKSIDDLANIPGLGGNFVKMHHAQLEQTFIIK